MESDEEDWEDLISSMGPRTLDISDDNLNFCDEEESQKGKSYFEALSGRVE